MSSSHTAEPQYPLIYWCLDIGPLHRARCLFVIFTISEKQQIVVYMCDDVYNKALMLTDLLLFAEGFDCRCGNLFCAIHRYSDKHDCPYDYRSAAAARIRKENPIVVAEKIQKLWGLSAKKKKKSLTLWIWTMATWMKTPDIMASFVHGSLRRAGRGGDGGGEVAAAVQTLPLLASPSLSTSDCGWTWVFLCVRVCLYESVCVCVCTFAWESGGRELRGLVDIGVAVGREGIWFFYPFLFLNLGGSCEFIFLQSLWGVVEMRQG